MKKITIQYTRDEEMIETHCLADEIRSMLSGKRDKVKVLNPEGEEENK